jgi:hypothetical protein
MSKQQTRAAGLALVACGALWLGHCGGGGSGAGPTAPVTPVTTTPTPTPAPAADPPISQSCAKLPLGSSTTKCEPGNPEYLDAVEGAMRTLQAEQPGIFEGDQVLSVGAFYVGVIKILDRQGLCASTEGEELGVTDSASSNEQYDILSFQNRARFGPVIYRTTCTPSAVPFSMEPRYPQPAGCSLPRSREVACGREPEGRYLGHVSEAVEQIQKDKPELFDFNDLSQQGWPAVRNIDAYFTGVVELLAKKGYCARHDGEEVQLKHGSNTFSEQYDIDFQHKYIRTGDGIYRASCYPAAF